MWGQRWHAWEGGPESGVGRLSGVVKWEGKEMIPHIQQTHSSESEMTKLDCLSTFKASGRDTPRPPSSKNSPASLWFALYRCSAIVAKTLPPSLHLNLEFCRRDWALSVSVLEEPGALLALPGCSIGVTCVPFTCESSDWQDEDRAGY